MYELKPSLRSHSGLIEENILGRNAQALADANSNKFKNLLKLIALECKSAL